MLDGFVRWIGGFIFVCIIVIFFIIGSHNSINKKIENQTDEFKNTVHIKILAELEKGNYLHRVIDEELGKVCYLNAVGGGIQCFPLNNIKHEMGMTTEQIKQLTRTHKKPKRYNY